MEEKIKNVQNNKKKAKTKKISKNLRLGVAINEFFPAECNQIRFLQRKATNAAVKRFQGNNLRPEAKFLRSNSRKSTGAGYIA